VRRLNAKIRSESARTKISKRPMLFLGCWKYLKMIQRELRVDNIVVKKSTLIITIWNFSKIYYGEIKLEMK